jgi:hypothetical protein
MSALLFGSFSRCNVFYSQRKMEMILKPALFWRSAKEVLMQLKVGKLFLCVSAASALIGVAMSSSAQSKQGGTQAAVSQKTARSQRFDLVNPSEAELKDKLVEVSPGVVMQVGPYLKDSSLKGKAGMQTLFTAQFQRDHLRSAPVYLEKVVAILTIEPKDACAMPVSDAVPSVCFKPKSGAKALMNEELRDRPRRAEPREGYGGKCLEARTA